MPVILLSLAWLTILFFIYASTQPEPFPEQKCIAGVEYFISPDNGSPTAVVIDASTKAPKLCEIKNVSVQ